ncbi:MAG TPA: nicotinamide riboside transporter PnuC, partial [Oceanospirillales bacterium]|nr:nicotinamide riboside transporter PnuC [Oceanospirillales bacterium]
MQDFFQKISQAFMAQSILEIIAVICATLYLILVVKENIWCWFFAFISTALFIYLFHSVSLLSESLLNIYYLIMAIYGWLQWKNKSNKKHNKIQFWHLSTHIK